MGGLGSGKRWHKKTVVEACLPLDAAHWMREGILKAGVHQSGRWQWTYTGGHQCTINYEANTTDLANAFLRVMYNLPSRQESFDYRVRLTSTRPQFGGLRWWFICPLVIDGQACCRRVGKLFLAPGGRYFGCRHCYDLTYTTCQRSHVDECMLRTIAKELGCGIEAVRAMRNRLGAAGI
jgi:hypothetical protein